VPELVYVNGSFVPASEAKVSVFDRGYLYGDGVFEGIRGYNGRIFRLNEHLRRLYRSAQAIWLEIPMSLEQLREVVLETVRRNNLTDCYIRLVVSRGVGDLGLNPLNCHGPATVIVIASHIALYPAEVYEQGLELITCSTRRNIPDALSPQIKSLNYLNNIMAKIEVVRAGAHEGIMLNSLGHIAEATGDNIFVVRDGSVHTPPCASGILDGITRDVVLELAKKLGLPCQEEMLTLYDVYTADECFLTGTAAEIVPVARCDGRTIGDGKPGPITKRLMERFKEVTVSEGVPVG
jgi:branched-chain amino acid aminotransferase